MPLVKYIILLVFCLPVCLQAQLPELIPYRKGNLWGYADSTGKIVIQPQWTSASLFYDNGLAMVGYRYKTSYGDTDSYKQVIDKKGRYLLTDVMLDSILNIYGFNGKGLEGMKPDLEFDANYIIVQYLELEYLYYTYEGSLVLKALPDNQSGEDEHSPYDNAFRFNRQLLHKKSTYVFCDNMCKELDIGRYDAVEDYYGAAFNQYVLYRYCKNDTKDTVTINPDGPAAAMCKGKQVLFIDTSGAVLFKVPYKEYLGTITVLKHPLNKQSNQRYRHQVRPLGEKSLEVMAFAPGTEADVNQAMLPGVFCYKDKYGRIYYEP